VRESKKFRKIIYDPDALEAWVRDNYEDIYVYCYCNVRNQEDAQDITQNVFLSFLSSLERYVEYGKLKNYLFVIARNKIKDHWKKTATLPTDEDWMRDRAEDLFSETQIVEKMDILESIASLGESDRELIVLRYYQGLTIKEIAAITGKPASTIRYAIKRAEARLRFKIEGI
jgi:RNA polymerase sigma-70 factor (ECF subfamily)